MSTSQDSDRSRMLPPALSGSGDRIVDVPGLPRLVRDRLGKSSVVRWATIAPNGFVKVHESENRIGYDRRRQVSMQWRLLLDIRRVVDPNQVRNNEDSYASWRQVEFDPLGGFFVEPWMPSHTSQPLNQIAGSMMAIAEGWPTDRHLRAWGTVLFLGYCDDRGLHASLTDDQVSGLRALAERGRRSQSASERVTVPHTAVAARVPAPRDRAFRLPIRALA